MTPLEARLAKGYTQAYLSYRARISERTIRTAEHTGAWPRRLSTRRRYAKVLGVSPKDLAVHAPWAELLAEREARLKGAHQEVSSSAPLAAFTSAAAPVACAAYGLPSVDATQPVVAPVQVSVSTVPLSPNMGEVAATAVMDVPAAGQP